MTKSNIQSKKDAPSPKEAPPKSPTEQVADKERKALQENTEAIKKLKEEYLKEEAPKGEAEFIKIRKKDIKGKFNFTVKKGSLPLEEAPLVAKIEERCISMLYPNCHCYKVNNHKDVHQCGGCQKEWETCSTQPPFPDKEWEEEIRKNNWDSRYGLTTLEKLIDE